jgi:hypothetical protein
MATPKIVCVLTENSVRAVQFVVRSIVDDIEAVDITVAERVMKHTTRERGLAVDRRMIKLSGQAPTCNNLSLFYTLRGGRSFVPI